MHKDAIVEWYLRRSFGTAWDEPYDVRIHGNVKTKSDKHDNVESVQDRIHWLFRLVCSNAIVSLSVATSELTHTRMKRSTGDVCENCEDGGVLL